jgi:hypothetical protein
MLRDETSPDAVSGDESTRRACLAPRVGEMWDTGPPATDWLWLWLVGPPVLLGLLALAVHQLLRLLGYG